MAQITIGYDIVLKSKHHSDSRKMSSIRRGVINDPIPEYNQESLLLKIQIIYFKGIPDSTNRYKYWKGRSSYKVIASGKHKLPDELDWTADEVATTLQRLSENQPNVKHCARSKKHHSIAQMQRNIRLNGWFNRRI